MIIKTARGRRVSVVTPEEREKHAVEILSGYSSEVREAIGELIKSVENGDTELFDLLNTARLRRPIVSMEEFMEDDYYLGEPCRTVYPRLKEELIRVFDGDTRELILTGAIGWGKCLSAATEYYDPVAGRRSTVGERSGAVSVVAHHDGRAVVAEGRIECTGMKVMGDLVFASGRRVRMSPDHPVLTQDGFVPAGELREQHLVATVRRVPSPARPLVVPDEEVEFVAFMLAEGACSSGNWTFTNADAAVLTRFSDCSTELHEGWSDPGVTVKEAKGKMLTVYPRGTKHLQRRYGLFGTSHEKRIPAEFYGLDDRQLALFLNRIWACDGSLYVGSPAKVEIALASESFIRDLQFLLLRFGVHGRSCKIKKRYTHNGERRESDAWRLTVTSKDEIERFLAAVGPVLSKEATCAELREIDAVCNPNVDVTPVSIEVLKDIRREVGPIRRGQYWPGMLPGQRMSAKRLARVRELYGLPELYRWWPEVFWDRVVEYEVGTVAEPAHDIEVPGVSNFAPSGIVVHNTTFLSIVLARILYELSCLAHPQATFGLSPGSEMGIVLVSKNLPLARRVLKTAVDDKLKLSPYFQEHWKPKIGKDETIFPDNIVMMIASYQSERLLGVNVLAGAMDETNFAMTSKQQIITKMGEKASVANYDLAEKVYTTLLTRIKSRFQRAGELTGMMILASSASTEGSFIDRRLREAEVDPTSTVLDFATWDVKPKSYFTGRWFKVLVGGSALRSRILSDDEVIDDDFLAENEARLIAVPEEYRLDFELNLEDALRDVAGIATQAISAYLQRIEAIDACVIDRPHPFSVDTWQYGTPARFEWDRLCLHYTRKIAGGYEELAWKPLRNPNAPRWLHVDTSLSGDSTGIAVGHIEKWVEVVRRNSDGEAYTDVMPYIVMDLMLRINPPPGEQIYLPDVRRLIYELAEHGFLFIGCSFDQYQSAEMMQQLKARGLPAKLISVDKTTAPYDALKSAIYERRIEFYRYEAFLAELKALEYDRVKGKVDHPLAGSKDVSDAVAGVVFGLLDSAARLPLVRDATIQREEGDLENFRWVSQLIPAEQVTPEMAETARQREDAGVMPVPFLMGGDE